jgi:hypothetical protein
MIERHVFLILYWDIKMSAAIIGTHRKELMCRKNFVPLHVAQSEGDTKSATRLACEVRDRVSNAAAGVQVRNVAEMDEALA